MKRGCAFGSAASASPMLPVAPRASPRWVFGRGGQDTAFFLRRALQCLGCGRVMGTMPCANPRPGASQGPLRQELHERATRRAGAPGYPPAPPPGTLFIAGYIAPPVPGGSASPRPAQHPSLSLKCRVGEARDLPASSRGSLPRLVTRSVRNPTRRHQQLNPSCAEAPVLIKRTCSRRIA